MKRKGSDPIAKVEYRGYLTHVVRHGDYGFILRNTINPIDSRDAGICFRGDLRLHVKKNPDLGDPLPRSVWITFFVAPDPRSKDGMEAVQGQLDI